MDLEKYASLDAVALAELVRQGDTTPHELAKLAAEAAARVNPTLNAIIELYGDRITAPASPNPEQPFAGVPMLVKDLSVTQKGRLHECGSQLLKGSVSSQDSELFKRFRKAGFNIIGRTTTPEFGWSASTECRLTGTTRNPWNVERSAGGSSGGSAAAIAAGVVPIAHGSDGSGSIRNPASWCGLVGLKTTRGRISTAPHVGMPPGGRPVSFVMSRSVRDSAAVLDAVHGNIGGDPFKIAPPPRPYIEEVGRPLKPLRIAVSSDPWNGKSLSSSIRMAFDDTVQLLAELGHELVEARPSLDWSPLVDAILDTVAAGIAYRVDAASNLMGRTPSRENLQHTTWATYQHGKSLSASRLLAAIEYLDQVSRTAGPFFTEFPILLTPTSIDVAPKHGTHNADRADLSAREWSEIIHSEDCFLLLANVTGQPAISLPLHETGDGLPVGMQLMSGLGDEAILFRLAGQLEASLPWHNRRPRIHAAAANVPKSNMEHPQKHDGTSSDRQ
ncbi:MAG: amidase [Alphaproteobacteria bacterium]|nr:amidase [Alphaproteobacteria bacterium]